MVDANKNAVGEELEDEQLVHDILPLVSDQDLDRPLREQRNVISFTQEFKEFTALD